MSSPIEITDEMVGKAFAAWYEEDESAVLTPDHATILWRLRTELEAAAEAMRPAFAVLTMRDLVTAAREAGLTEIPLSWLSEAADEIESGEMLDRVKRGGAS